MSLVEVTANVRADRPFTGARLGCAGIGVVR